MSNKQAAYLFSPEGKDYDYDLMQNLLLAKVGDLQLDEVYADGWDEIPNDMEELLEDLDKYSLVVLLNLEGVSISTLNKIVNKCALMVAMLPHLGTARSSKDDIFKALVAVKRGEAYYKDLRGLKIRAGLKKTTKQVGNVPFGHERKEDGTVQPIPEQMELAKKVADWYKAGYPVTDISARSNGLLTTRQVYSLVSYWGVKRG